MDKIVNVSLAKKAGKFMAKTLEGKVIDKCLLRVILVYSTSISNFDLNLN